jgi:hypothetical protein
VGWAKAVKLLLDPGFVVSQENLSRSVMTCGVTLSGSNARIRAK